jgi:hyperosmotically inducible protein
MFRTLSLGLVGLLMVSGSARADVAERKDLQVSHDIKSAITHYTHFTIFDDVQGIVEDGVVTLTGKMTMPYKVDAIAKRVAKIDGVREVHNNIAVLPVSGYDDQLRLRVARAIYGNPNFRYYGMGANPSIHIIVEGGRVTLKGVVNGDVDRRLAGLLAERFPALSVKNELRTTAEVRDAGESD